MRSWKLEQSNNGQHENKIDMNNCVKFTLLIYILLGILDIRSAFLTNIILRSHFQRHRVHIRKNILLKKIPTIESKPCRFFSALYSTPDEEYYQGMDAYQILGVPKNADKATIKAAYRKAIQDWHPDKFGTDEVKKKEGNSRLEKINRAYYILSDEDRRQRYDRYGEQGVGSSASSEEQMENGGGFGFSGFGGDGQDLSSLFQSLFGGLGEDSIGFDINDLGMGGGSIRNKRNAKQQGENIIMQHTIPFSKVISGSIDTLKVKRQETCKLCNGSGCKPGSKSSKCSTCNGQGLVENIQRTSMGMFKSFSECGKCQGQGEIISDPCSGCNGKGVCFTTSDVLLNIPPGVDAGMTLSIRGEGNAGIKKGQNGDLLVKINIIKDPLFTRDGIDIHTTETISYVEAILGTTIAANSIDGKFNVSVPAGVQPGQKLKIKSKGIPKIGQNYRGDQYITVKVLIPSNVSGPEKEMIEKISALRQKRDIENS